MASGKRASMREGPLAQLFRKTEDDASPDAKREEAPRREEGKPPSEPRTGRPLPQDSSPQATRQVPEPQAQEEEHTDFEHRATEAARRAEERARRRE